MLFGNGNCTFMRQLIILSNIVCFPSVVQIKKYSNLFEDLHNNNNSN